MPSVSSKQARFFAAAAHDKEFAKKAGIPQGVAKDFNQADAGTGILKKEEPSDEMKKEENEKPLPEVKKKKSRMQKMYPTHKGSD